MRNQIKDIEVRKWMLRCLIAGLQIDFDLICQGDNQGCNAGQGRYNGRNGCHSVPAQRTTLSPERTHKTATVYFKPTFIGYLKIVWRLLQEPFRKKKVHHFIVIQ